MLAGYVFVAVGCQSEPLLMLTALTAKIEKKNWNFSVFKYCWWCLHFTIGSGKEMANKSEMKYVFYCTRKRQLFSLISIRLPIERWDNSYISVVNTIIYT